MKFVAIASDSSERSKEGAGELKNVGYDII